MGHEEYNRLSLAIPQDLNIAARNMKSRSVRELKNQGGLRLHSLVSLSRPILYFLAFAVREFPEKDDKEINHRPNSQAADGEELDDTRTHLASVETMGPENPEKEAKQRCQQSFLVTHLRFPFLL